MNSALMLGAVLLATFGLAALLFDGLVAVAWYSGLNRARIGSADLLALRLLPVAGALLFSATVVLPAFLLREPHQVREAAGPLLLILAAFSLITLGHGIWRGWRAWLATGSILRECGHGTPCIVENGQIVQVVEVSEPIVGVIGSWRPRVVIAESIVSACSRDEFRQVIAHEASHLSARDNLKLLLLLSCPDALAWTALDAPMSDRWRAEAEFEADQRAAGDDPHKRLALASALIKVARLFDPSHRVRQSLTMSVALDDVENRVRQLLSPADTASAAISKVLVYFALLMPVAAIPLYALVHQLIETLVSCGL
jgi:hypothetical protein